MKRYIVLGLVRDVEAWRRERGLSRREVFPVSTHAHTARGYLSGEYEVVRLDSWALASDRARTAVDRDLQVMADMGCYTLTYAEPVARSARA